MKSFFSYARRALSPRCWRRMPVVLGAVVALVLGLGAGTAYAFFTSAGSGSGTALTGTVHSVAVLEASGTATNKLYPSGSGDLLLKLDNHLNSYSVKITSVVGNGAVTGSGGIGTCTTTGVSVPLLTNLSITVISGTSVSVVIPNGVSMDSTSDSGCQGATFQIPVTITVQK